MKKKQKRKTSGLNVKKQTIGFSHRECFNKHEVKQHASLSKESVPAAFTGSPTGKDTLATAGSLAIL